MAYYLRKSFRAGPLRINLSKSGLGLSAGVKGARIGVSSRGKAYVHAGRGGLYFRKQLDGSSGRRAGRTGSAGEPSVIWQDTGVTFGRPPELSPLPAPPRPRAGPAILYRSLALVAGAAMIISYFCGKASDPVLFVGIVLCLLAPVPLYRGLEAQRAARRLRDLLKGCLADRKPLSGEKVAAMRAAMQDRFLAPSDRARIAETAFRDLVLIDLDCDQGLLGIIKDGSQRPILITTPEAMKAATILATLTKA